MVIETPSVLPSETLTPTEARRRFNVTQLAGLMGLRGLGQVCCDGSTPDENEQCADGSYASESGCGGGTIVEPAGFVGPVQTVPGQTVQYTPGTIVEPAGFVGPVQTVPGQTVQYTPLATPACGANQVYVNGQCVSYSVSASGAVQTGNSSADAAIAAAVAAGLKLAQIAVIQPGTVVSPSGTVSRAATGTPITSAQTGLGLSQIFSGTSGSTTILMLGLGLAAVLLLTGKKGS